ncbi:hypothetical protein [Breoghania sp. L-A4]|uniref:hypothetical protein n=1 Tax=Breoghania sp. L-A4 TaxID=2304600 RepID=UPI0013C2E806|nr:hypothetical protein [Breoghania sp. L-A4]
MSEYEVDESNLNENSNEFKKADHSEFVFDFPLYSKIKYINDFSGADILKLQNEHIEGFCNICKRTRIFYCISVKSGMQTLMRQHPNGIVYHQEVGGNISFVRYECSADKDHVIDVIMKLDVAYWQKIGQYPTLADISKAELRKYRSVLTSEYQSELNKAIGLASHGANIGAFVYLRRVFEGLIELRAIEQNMAEMKEFKEARIGEKIDLLKEHLPKIMVDNKKIYGMLSAGVHDYTEDKCGGYLK